MALIRFINCALLDVVAGVRREGVEVVVEGERIVEVSDKPGPLRAAETIDLRGRTLMPGLIDAHMHAVAADTNLAKLAEQPASLTAQQSRRLLEAMLKRGFTTVRDAGGADWGLAQAVEMGLIDGPRMFIAGLALSQTGGHADLRPRTQGFDPCACSQSGGVQGRICDGVPEVRRAARDEMRKGASQIKIMASGGIASPNDPIWNLQFAEEEIRAIVEEARAWQTYVMAHTYTAAAIRRCIEFGVRSIEHGNLIDRPTAEFAAIKGAFVVPTLITFDAMHRFGKDTGMPASSLAKLEDVRGAGLQAIEILRTANVKIGFGTDLLGPMQVHQTEEFLLRAEVMPAIDILRSATLVNAELLHRAGELGVIAVGAYADMLVVDGDPLADLGVLQNQGAHLAVIMKGGRFYKRTL